MTTITSLGVGSGIDAESIISALMSAESRPLSLLKTEASSISSKISIWGNVSSYVSSLQDAVRDLSSVSIWNGMKASSSNDSAVGVSSDDGATAGSHSVNVTNLAVGQTLASGSFTDSATTLSAGSLTLQLGTWAGSSFTAKSGSNPVSITVAADDSLAGALGSKAFSSPRQSEMLWWQPFAETPMNGFGMKQGNAPSSRPTALQIWRNVEMLSAVFSPRSKPKLSSIWPGASS